jgi:PleD family two-component response regulator
MSAATHQESPVAQDPLLAQNLQLAPHDILVVDDTPANLRLLAVMLGREGYQVRTAGSGEQALAAVDSYLPDLILLDVSMPCMSGYEVCERLKASPRTRDIPVLFVSAMDQTEDKVKAFAVGGVDYITKPIHFEEVLARVQTHLSLRELQDRLRRANAELERRLAELQAALDQVRTLSGLLPICASCKKIRDDHGYWHQVEAYIEDHSDAEFTHGICPECARRLYPEFMLDAE